VTSSKLRHPIPKVLINALASFWHKGSDPATSHPVEFLQDLGDLLLEAVADRSDTSPFRTLHPVFERVICDLMGLQVTII
jgi:hypothetical protein